MVYVAFVIDVFSRRILGWRAASRMTTDLVLDAFEHALWSRQQQGVDRLDGLVHHTDAGSQGGFKWSSQHLDVGGVQDGYQALEHEDWRCPRGVAASVAG